MSHETREQLRREWERQDRWVDAWIGVVLGCLVIYWGVLAVGAVLMAVKGCGQ